MRGQGTALLATMFCVSMVKPFPWIFLLSATPLVLYPAEPIADEMTQSEILKAVFPKTAVQVVVGRSINESWRPKDRRKDLFFPDALAAERVYHVSGPPVGEIERCASENMETETFFQTRELRMRLYPWPGAADSRSDVLAILQYKFLKAAPAGSCYSIARLLHVSRRMGTWHVNLSFLMDTTHHTAINRIDLVDLDGDRIEELVIESNSGGGGMVGSDLVVFSLKEGGFRQWLNVPSRLHEWIEKEDEYVQVLDIPRTISEGARRLCFTKTVFAADGQWFQRPRTTRPCYPRFTGRSARGGLLPPMK
jgi:hypothetical protein